jgi:hypothetical protein
MPTSQPSSSRSTIDKGPNHVVPSGAPVMPTSSLRQTRRLVTPPSASQSHQPFVTPAAATAMISRLVTPSSTSARHQPSRSHRPVMTPTESYASPAMTQPSMPISRLVTPSSTSARQSKRLYDYTAPLAQDTTILEVQPAQQTTPRSGNTIIVNPTESSTAVMPPVTPATPTFTSTNYKEATRKTLSSLTKIIYTSFSRLKLQNSTHFIGPLRQYFTQLADNGDYNDDCFIMDNVSHACTPPQPKRVQHLDTTLKDPPPPSPTWAILPPLNHKQPSSAPADEPQLKRPTPTKPSPVDFAHPLPRTSLNDGPYSGNHYRLIKSPLQLTNDSTEAFFIFYNSLRSHFNSCGFNTALLPTLQSIQPDTDLTKPPVDIPPIGTNTNWNEEHNNLSSTIFALLTRHDVIATDATRSSQIVGYYHFQGAGFLVLQELMRLHHPRLTKTSALDYNHFKESYPTMIQSNTSDEQMDSLNNYFMDFTNWKTHLQLHPEAIDTPDAEWHLQFIDGLSPTLRPRVDREETDLLVFQRNHYLTKPEPPVPKELRAENIYTRLRIVVRHLAPDPPPVPLSSNAQDEINEELPLLLTHSNQARRPPPWPPPPPPITKILLGGKASSATCSIEQNGKNRNKHPNSKQKVPIKSVVSQPPKDQKVVVTRVDPKKFTDLWGCRDRCHICLPVLWTQDRRNGNVTISSTSPLTPLAVRYFSRIIVL